MKVCPVCQLKCFDDMEICYGCMHRFDQAQDGQRHGDAGGQPDAGSEDRGSAVEARETMRIPMLAKVDGRESAVSADAGDAVAGAWAGHGREAAAEEEGRAFAGLAQAAAAGKAHAWPLEGYSLVISLVPSRVEEHAGVV